jgi:Na+-translocating ferredoxin:NAD+ oxidoreductase subunit B
MLNTIIIIASLTGIGLLCGLLIFIVHRSLPKEPEALKKTEEISNELPGVNCGACGYPGCFAYAQALAKDPEVILDSPCPSAMQDEATIENLERVLNLKLDLSQMGKKAFVACTGDNRRVADYSGVKTCKGSSLISGGDAQCIYGCLGYGDCVSVCPQDAITINKKRNVAVIDPLKCTGCGLCVDACPKKIIKLVPSKAKNIFLCSYDSLKNIPGRDRCDRGCIHCRKCFKACENEGIIWNKEKGIPEFDYDKCIDCEKCIISCPENKILKLYEITKNEELEPEEAKKEKSLV